MDTTKFVVALVVVVASIYLWYQRGLTTRDHELCLDVTQALMEKQPWSLGFDKAEHNERYIDIYTSWYSQCRIHRFASRNDLTLVPVDEAERQDTD